MLNVDVAADADDDYNDMRLCEEKRRNGMVMANNIRTNEECVFPLMFSVRENDVGKLLL